MTASIFATNAYKIAQGLANQSQKGQSAAGDATGADFGAMLKDVVGKVVDQGRAAESKQMAMAAGKADVIDVVTAVSETEMALDTMVSMRDKVIQAYEEIMRMPI